MNYKITFPAVLLSLGILNGCGAARPSKFYELTAPDNSTVGADPAPYPVTLLLGRMATSNLYLDDRIVYTSSGQAMGKYEYQRWAEPPPEMITNILLRELRASGRYRQIYSLGSNVRGDYLLRGHLYDFREIDGKVLLARVAFDFELDKSKTGAIVWTRYYSHDEPVDGKDVAAVVAAIDRNVQSGLTEIIGGLDEYFSKQMADALLARH